MTDIVYTPAQIAQFAYNAGFRGTALIQSVAVALAESEGDTDIHSTDGDNSVGLWQFIPATWASITGTPFSNASDPQQNANAAFKLYTRNGNTFAGQWSTWPSAAQAFIPAATVAAATVHGTAAVGGTVNTAGAGNDATATDTGFDWDPLNWPGDLAKSAATSILGPAVEFGIEAGMVLGGAIMLLIGAIMILKDVR